MTRTSSSHLIDMLAEVPDPRNKKGKRHPLKSISNNFCKFRGFVVVRLNILSRYI